jgi:hypothetical protein
MASTKQKLLSQAPKVGLLFGDVNPDKVRDSNAIVGLPSFWTFNAACERALQYVKSTPFWRSKIGAEFHISPGSGTTLEMYAEHLVSVDGNKMTSNTKLKGLRSIHKTLDDPSFCLRDDRPGNNAYLYGRVYRTGEIHIVVVDYSNLRVKTQYLFNDQDNSGLMKLEIVGVRGDWPEPE